VNISRVNSLTGLPKGALYALEGVYSDIYAYAAFLSEYFGMIPDCASAICPARDEFKETALSFFRRYSLAGAFEKSILYTDAELVFGNANTIAKLKLRGLEFSGIEISLPSMGYLDVVQKSHLGLSGALLITEQVLNGLLFR